MLVVQYMRSEPTRIKVVECKQQSKNLKENTYLFLINPIMILYGTQRIRNSDEL